jgi:hypothetical protein
MVGCFQDNKRRSWRFFAARMSALNPATKYSYSIEHETGANKDNHRNFFSPPLPGTSRETDIIFVGDTRYPGSDAIFSDMASLTDYHDLIVHVGDGTYGTNNGECYGEQKTRDGTSKCGWACSGTQCAAAERMSANVMDKIRSWVKSFDEKINGWVVYFYLFDLKVVIPLF